jgi:His-Xaa-Ser system protein HxsD
MSAEVVVEFDAATQSLASLNAAAYRLSGTAACHIDEAGGRYLCRLSAPSASDLDTLRHRYLQLVTDENVREALRSRTEPVRNLILSLAFGALAAPSADSSTE